MQQDLRIGCSLAFPAREDTVRGTDSRMTGHTAHADAFFQAQCENTTFCHVTKTCQTYILAGAEGIYQLLLKLFPIQFTWKSKTLRSWFQRKGGQAAEKELSGVTFPISQVLLWTGQCCENSGKQLQGFAIGQLAPFNNIHKQVGKLC